MLLKTEALKVSFGCRLCRLSVLTALSRYSLIIRIEILRSLLCTTYNSSASRETSRGKEASFSNSEEGRPPTVCFLEVSSNVKGAVARVVEGKPDGCSVVYESSN